MINEVLNEILVAEQQAEQIINEAREKEGQISAESDKNCSTIIENANAQAKLEREKIRNQAFEEGEREYQRIIDQSKSEAENLQKEKSDRVKQAGEHIFGRIVNGNC